MMAKNHDSDKLLHESYALFLLQSQSNYDYSGLQHGDKPDLYDKEHKSGVEVVRIVIPKHEEARKNYKYKAKGKLKSSLSPSSMKKFANVGYQVFTKGQLTGTTDDTVCAIMSPAMDVDIPFVVGCLRQKLDTIAKNQYQECSALDLFVSEDDTYLDTEEEILTVCAQALEGRKTCVRNIIFFCNINLFFYDVKAHTVTILELEEAKIKEALAKARAVIA